MRDYYEGHLSGARLLECYRLAPPRIQQYLDREIRFVLGRVRGARFVLELGCGYGRVMKRLAPFVATIVGCDTSEESLRFATSYLGSRRNWAVVRTDAARTGFRAGMFDATVCVQNGISAFGVDGGQLVAEAARITRGGGQIVFSSYSPRIWQDRLAWFGEQARAGLIGPIDPSRTRDGTIVCTDGFRATTVDAGGFWRLFEGAGLSPELHEVDNSSLFCVAVKDADPQALPPVRADSAHRPISLESGADSAAG
ncbi:MAG TPA: class I SAM-dependent methyltransferase [Thermoplasmata archaeon]|nr:class I SAM-dependent methyltransferase [Thermoplasmata archaeon]